MAPERLSLLGLAPGHKRKKRNKPSFAQPILNQWVVNGFQYGGAVGSATSRRSLHREMRGPRAKSRPGPEEQQRGNNELSQERRTEASGTTAATKMTKQSQFLITTIKSSNLHCCGRVEQGASPLLLPRGGAKCVRGPSVQGVRRSAPRFLNNAGVLEPYVEHGEQAQRRNGGPIACFGRQLVRRAD